MKRRDLRAEVINFLQGRLSPERQAFLRRRLRPARLGNLRRTTPVSQRYGFDRGTPVDRYYIDKFLTAHRADIRGCGLEVKNAGYLRRYGTGLERVDILDIDASNPDATIVADLSAADGAPDAAFDCFVLTQTLQFIYDWRAALGHARRILRPGGVLLVTVPAVSRLDRTLSEIDYWRFTPPGCRRMFGEVFGADRVRVESYGNVLSANAFLMGLAAEELTAKELETADPAFPVLIGVRAVA